LKDMVTILGILVIVCSLGIILIHYQREGNSQDSVFLALNDTVKTEVEANVSKGESRIDKGALYVNIPKFEKETREKLAKPIGSNVTAKSVTFRYLKGKGDQIKAVSVKMEAGGKTYQTTLAVDRHQSLED